MPLHCQAIRSIRKIYAAEHEILLTAFLQWYWGAGEIGLQSTLLHSISSYVYQMGRSMSLWDDLSFDSKDEVT